MSADLDFEVFVTFSSQSLPRVNDFSVLQFWKEYIFRYLNLVTGQMTSRVIQRPILVQHEYFPSSPCEV